MGDRGNIIVQQSDGSRIYLYSHWAGSELPVILQTALRKKWRWDDDSYLTRIIFSEMIKDELLGEVGYGISTRRTDNQHPLLVVDCEEQTVTVEDESGDTHQEWSFDEYIALASNELSQELEKIKV